jgi:hypothetical protein
MTERAIQQHVVRDLERPADEQWGRQGHVLHERSGQGRPAAQATFLVTFVTPLAKVLS